MVPAGRQGYPKATIGSPKGDIVDHNWTTPSEEDRICWVVKLPTPSRISIPRREHVHALLSHFLLLS